MMPLNEARLVRASVFWWIGLLCLFGWGSVPGLLQTPYAVLVIALLVLHIALHWVMLYWPIPTRWWLAYFAIQAALVFGIGYLTPYITLPLGLFAIVTAQAIGYDLPLWQRGTVIGACIVLMTFLISVTDGVEQTMFAPLLAGVVVFLLMVLVVATLYQRQIQARNQAEALVAELRHAHDQLQSYADQVEDLTLIHERQRMARELHDTLAQGLAGLILQLEAVEAHLMNERTVRAQEIVQHAMVRARTALADSRRTIDHLRGTGTTTDDVGTTLRAEVARFRAATSLIWHLDIDDLLPVSETVRDHAVRAITESLTNVIHHAQATEVWVRVAQEKEALLLDIRDNGIGFDLAALQPQPGHYGLVGLNERAQLTGGILEITSAPGAGTRVRFWFPVSMKGTA